MGKNKATPDEGLVLHMALNSIRAYNLKFKHEYGEMIIAREGKSWRYDVFPYYKANRKKAKEESGIDWKEVFRIFNVISDDLTEYFPYRVVSAQNGEADDVIGTLCNNFGNTNEKILIISTDKDFQQLQKYINVRQFDPVRKKFLDCNNPETYLKAHIIRAGDDGIPNILSDDDTFVDVTKRQKPISSKKLDIWINQSPEQFCDTRTLRNYNRNRQLINLIDCIPEYVQEQVLESYDRQSNKNRSKMFNYFITKKLKLLHEAIGDF